MQQIPTTAEIDAILEEGRRQRAEYMAECAKRAAHRVMAAIRGQRTAGSVGAPAHQ